MVEDGTRLIVSSEESIPDLTCSFKDSNEGAQNFGPLA